MNTFSPFHPFVNTVFNDVCVCVCLSVCEGERKVFFLFSVMSAVPVPSKYCLEY